MCRVPSLSVYLRARACVYSWARVVRLLLVHESFGPFLSFSARAFARVCMVGAPALAHSYCRTDKLKIFSHSQSLIKRKKLKFAFPYWQVIEFKQAEILTYQPFSEKNSQEDAIFIFQRSHMEQKRKRNSISIQTYLPQIQLGCKYRISSWIQGWLHLNSGQKTSWNKQQLGLFQYNEKTSILLVVSLNQEQLFACRTLVLTWTAFNWYM